MQYRPRSTVDNAPTSGDRERRLRRQLLSGLEIPHIRSSGWRDRTEGPDHSVRN